MPKGHEEVIHGHTFQTGTSDVCSRTIYITMLSMTRSLDLCNGVKIAGCSRAAAIMCK